MSIISRYRLIPSWLRPIKAPVSIILCINFFLLVLLAIIGSKKHINIATLMRDPVATAGLPFYTGFFSNLGVLFWFATAAICLFSSWLLLKTQQQREFRIFLFYSGLLSLFLTLDDLFLFHEYDGFLPVILHILEKVVYLLY